jgi:hypothetical protein
VAGPSRPNSKGTTSVSEPSTFIGDDDALTPSVRTCGDTIDAEPPTLDVDVVFGSGAQIRTVPNRRPPRALRLKRSEFA